MEEKGEGGLWGGWGGGVGIGKGAGKSMHKLCGNYPLADLEVAKRTKYLRVLSATFILSKNSRVLDATSRQESANIG